MVGRKLTREVGTPPIRHFGSIFVFDWLPNAPVCKAHSDKVLAIDGLKDRTFRGVGPVVYAAGLSIRYFTGSNPVHPAIVFKIWGHSPTGSRQRT